MIDYGDNFRFDITSIGAPHFQAAMQFAFRENRNATHYATRKGDLILYWSKCGTPLLYQMGLDAAVSFAWNWLLQAEYGPQPDHDGSNKKGFRVHNAVDEWEAFVIVKPEWHQYGK